MIRALTDPRHDHDHDVTGVMTVFMTAADLRWSEEVLVRGQRMSGEVGLDSLRRSTDSLAT